MFTVQIGTNNIIVEKLVRSCSRQRPDEWRMILEHGPQAARAGLSQEAMPGHEITLLWNNGKLDLRLLGWQTSPKLQGQRSVLATLIRHGNEPLSHRVWQGSVRQLLEAPAKWLTIGGYAELVLQHISLHACRPIGSRVASDSANRVLADLVGWLEHEGDLPVFLSVMRGGEQEGGLLLQVTADLPEKEFQLECYRIQDDWQCFDWGGPPGPRVIEEEWSTRNDVVSHLMNPETANGRSADSIWVITSWQGTWQRGDQQNSLTIRRQWQAGFPSNPGSPIGSGWMRLARMIGLEEPRQGIPPIAKVIPFDEICGKLMPITDVNHPLRCRLLTPYAGEKGANCGVHFVPEPGAIVAVASPSVFTRPTLLGEVREAACLRNGFGIFLPSDHSFGLTSSSIQIEGNEFNVAAESEFGAPLPPKALTPRSNSSAPKSQVAARPNEQASKQHDKGNHFRTTYRFSAASLSWIDPESKKFGFHLPEHDTGNPGKLIDQSIVLGKHAYRFANFLEASISVTKKPGAGNRPQFDIVDARFSPISGLHTNTSLLGTRVEEFPVQRKIEHLSESISPSGQQILAARKFTQLVGCRTEAPEKVAKSLGCFGGAFATAKMARSSNGWAVIGTLAYGCIIGIFVANEVVEEFIAFPPIWTELELIIYADGTHSSRMTRHSLFPSVCFYQLKEGEKYNQASNYDGVPNIENWGSNGWGSGNPWNIPSPKGLGNNR